MYGLIFITPLVGWMMPSARNFPVSRFGLFTLPDLAQPGTATYDFFREAHELLASALFVVATLHAFAELKQHFIDKDNVLTHVARESRTRETSRLLICELHHAFEAIRDCRPVPARRNELRRWAVEHAAEGQPTDFRRYASRRTVEGKFEKFTADIKFDPKDLATGRFDVKVDMTSVNTRDSERDSTLKGADLFSVKQFPTAQYVAEKFTDKGKGQYTAAGKLTSRNVTKDVPIEFTFEQKDTGAWLKGAPSIKRLDFGVGQGDWKDTETVANEVKVKFALLFNNS